MTHVLVTGGAGYVGGQSCNALGQAGYRPVVFDDFSTGHRDFVRWGPKVDGDIRDKAALLSAMKRYEPIAVMHI